MFKYDAIKPLLDSGKKAIVYFSRRDLLGEDAGDVRILWELPEIKKIIKKQQPESNNYGTKAHAFSHMKVTAPL